MYYRYCIVFDNVLKGKANIHKLVIYENNKHIKPNA